MSEYFMGQVMMTGFSFAPKNFARCDGQLLPIGQNQALFSLLGTTYGGDGRSSFGLPDLRGRTPLGFAASADPTWKPAAVALGQADGAEMVALDVTTVPGHTHTVQATNQPGDNRIPSNRLFATSVNTANPANLYGPASGPPVVQAAQSVASAGGGQAHTNMQPYSVLNFCIALYGIFPPRS